ncbi:MAG: type II toxin-antitoxin system YafQ family toxin [Bacteroidales bacterium]|nr:type II toxin-antitoxin system YafQ family toxin [Bacteroidales bacterium]
MYRIVFTKKFQRDYKLAQKRGLNNDLLNEVVRLLASEKKLPPNNKDHLLKGNYIGFRECHIQPDWLLIYLIDNDRKIVSLIRTGSHADLFS